MFSCHEMGDCKHILIFSHDVEYNRKVIWFRDRKYVHVLIHTPSSVKCFCSHHLLFTVAILLVQFIMNIKYPLCF